MTGHRARVVAVTVAAALVLVSSLAGCVTIPTSGPVEQVAPRGADSDVLPQVTPSGPREGATALQVSRGYVTAMRAFPVSTEVAQEFLTDEAAGAWAPGRRTIVYSSLTTVQRDRNTVELRTRDAVALSARGTYRPDPGGRQERVRSLRLQRTDQGWRIAALPDVLLVSEGFFEQYYRPFDLYFFTATAPALVADRVWLPLGDELATRLVQGLLAGPTRWLRGRAVTALSASADVGVSVPLRADGVADVQLGQEAAGLSATQRQLWSAQLVWTLRQVSGLEGVRVLVDGVPLEVPGTEPVQNVTAWAEYDPSGPSSRALLFGLRSGRVVTVESDSVTRLERWWGSRDAGLAEVTVERQLNRVAGTDSARRRLLAGPYGAESDRDVQTWYRSSGTLTDPQWDRTGQVWVLERGAGGTGSNRLVVVDRGRPRVVPAGGLRAAGIRGIAVSPDGARLAALVDRWDGRYWGGSRAAAGRGPVLVVGAIVRGQDGRTVRRVEQTYAVPVQERLRALAAPVWAGPSEVGVLARFAEVPPQPYDLAIDGSTVEGGVISGEALLGPVEARALAAAGVTGAATVVGATDGRLYAPDSQLEWAKLARGVVAPRHPD